MTAPPSLRVRLDSRVRRYGDGRVLLGGSPLRLLTLSAGGAAVLDGWIAGRPIGGDPAAAALARRLLDAGLLHPLGGDSPFTAADVTVVVPVRDNAAGVERLQDTLGGMAQVLVVDDGSASPLPGAAVRHQVSAGPAAARNAGARLAATALIAFLDSDVEPEPGWLDALLPIFADPDVSAAAPRVLARAGDGPLARYEADRCPLDLGAEPAPARPMSRVGYVPAAALLVRADALAAVGGFDETLRFGEDVDLAWRLIDAGWTVRYQPASMVRHQPRESLRGWLRQRYDYGTSAATLAERHPGRLAPARLSRWSALGWALAAAGHPVAATIVAAATAGLLSRKLRHRVPAPVALAVAARGHLGAGRLLADAVRRVWWPLALLTGRGRRVLAASLLPCLAAAVTRPGDLDRVRWLALRIADDLAYGTGVWAGCLQHGTAGPLRPSLSEWPGRSP